VKNFSPVDLQIAEIDTVHCVCAEHSTESMLWITLSGQCSPSSQPPDYGRYLYQKIGLSLLIVQPLAVLVDLRDLSYAYGDRIISLFEVFSHVRFLGEDNIITAFVLSDDNRYGLSSLLKFDPERPVPPFFYDVDAAFQYLWEEYDKI
jgi:hypothetical protein